MSAPWLRTGLAALALASACACVFERWLQPDQVLSIVLAWSLCA